MFVYEKKLQYPIKIKNTNPRLAALIISQYGGPDGELHVRIRCRASKADRGGGAAWVLKKMGICEIIKKIYSNLSPRAG